MNINELVLKNENEMTESQRGFMESHNRIIYAGNLMVSSLVDLATELKRIKEDKLYLEIDCETFEDYTEQILNLKKSQAYSYISVLDKLGSGFVRSNGKIGIAKLQLLASLPEEDRQTIVTQVDVDSTTVNELKEEIKTLKSREVVDLAEYDKLLVEITSIEEKNKNLKSEIKTLKNTMPGEKIVTKDSQKTLDKLKQLEDLVSKNQTILDDKILEIDNLKSKCENLNKQVEISSSTGLVEFKILFNVVQTQIIKLKDLLLQVPEDKQEGCKKALKTIGEMLC